MKISVLQWNIWDMEKIGNIAKTIKEIGPDIACLQEVAVYSEANPDIYGPHELASQLGMQYGFAPATCRWSIERTECEGVAILTKFPITFFYYDCIKKYKSLGNPWDTNPRVYAEAVVLTPQTHLAIGTTHSSFTNRFVNDEIKQREVDRIVGRIKSKREKFLFCADLNSLPNSYTYEQIHKYLQHCGPDLSLPTWTTKEHEFPDWAAWELEWRIDYIFATLDIQVLSAQIINTPYSDHLPILCEIEI